MKFKCCLLTFLITTISLAQATQTLKVPKGIVYHFCDSAIIEKAKQVIKADIDGTGYALSGSKLTIGPLLWKRFDGIKTLHAIEGGNTSFPVDGKELRGKITQNLANSQKVWDEVRKEVKGKKYTLRKLSPDELRYFWSVIAAEIEEPLLILETDSHSYILNIAKADMKLNWIDEALQH